MRRAAVPLTLVALGALAPGIVVAQPGRTPVRVEFRVAEPDYRRNFQSAELKTFEREAARRVARLLEERLPVLELIVDGTADHVLRVTLHRRGEDTGAPLSERGFHVSVAGPTPTQQEYWAEFRPADASGQGVGSPEAFLAEITSAFGRGDIDRLVANHLRAVPLAKGGRLFANPHRWVLPITMQALCMEPDSHILISNTFTNAFGVAERDEFEAEASGYLPPTPPDSLSQYANWLFSKPLPGQAERIGGLPEPSSVVVDAVFLLRYRGSGRLCQPMPAPPPPPAGAEGGTP